MVEFIKQVKTTQNAFIELFNRKYRLEILFFYQLRTLNEARETTVHWLKEYYSVRHHKPLNNLTLDGYRLMA